MTITLTTENFFDGHNLHGPTKIRSVDGKITEITPHNGECDHYCISPGFIDLQMNGFRDIDVSDSSADDLVALDELLLRAGTSFWLATVITSPLDRLGERVHFLDQLCLDQSVTGMLGIHIEGPFLGSAPGAHRPDWIVPIDRDWIGSLGDSVRVVTIAPEQREAVWATRVLSQRGVVVSMGHSKPSDDQMDDMIKAGATMTTHLFNGMSGVHHRDAGLALRTLIDDRVTAGLIGDMCHVSSDAVALAFAAKGGDGICLVSDTVAWESERAQKRGVHHDGRAPRLADGTLAGSSTPLAQCVQKCVVDAKVGLEDTLRAATLSPARLIGRPELATCQIGLSTNLVALNKDLYVEGAWRGLVSTRA